MNSSIPKPLFKSGEFWALSEHGRMVLRLIWRRGLAQTWGTETAPGREVLLRELQARGLFLGAEGPRVFDELVEACVAAGVLEECDELLTLPLLSGDRPAGQKTAEATRKDRQRQLDDLYPSRVEERKGRRSSGASRPIEGTPEGVTSSVTTTRVTPGDGHGVGPVTASVLAGEGVREEDEEISSSSSSSSEIPDALARADAPALAPAGHAPMSRPAPPPVSRPDVTPSRPPARVLLEESKGAVSLAPRSVCDAFDASLAAELPTFSIDDCAEVAAFVSDRRRLIEAFAGYMQIAADVKRTGSVSLAILRGRAKGDHHEFAPLLDLRERARAWRAAEASAVAAREQTRRDLAPKRPSNDAVAPPGPARASPLKPGDVSVGLGFGPRANSR